MTYEGIEFVIRAGLGRYEWTVTIHFPDASESNPLKAAAPKRLSAKEKGRGAAAFL